MKVLSKENAAHVFGPAVALHEIGHTLQMDHGLDERKSFLYLVMETMAKQFLLGFLVTLAPILKNGENLSHTRNNLRLLERNASAFSLSVMRKLREEGIDILRGYENRDVVSAFEFALNSYESSFIGIPGKKFRTNRKLKKTLKKKND